MPFDPVQDSWRMAPSNVAPRATRGANPGARRHRHRRGRRRRPPTPRGSTPAARPTPAPDPPAAVAAVPRRPRALRPTPPAARRAHAVERHGKATTQKKVRRAAESALDQPKGSLDHKKAEIKDVCREEVARLKKAEESRKRQRPPDADDDVVVTGSVNVIDAVAARIADAEKDGRVIEIGDDSPKKVGRRRGRRRRVLGRRGRGHRAGRARGRAARAGADPGRAAARAAAAAGRRVHVWGAGGAPDGADGPQLRPRVLRLPLRPRQRAAATSTGRTAAAPHAPGPLRPPPGPAAGASTWAACSCSRRCTRARALSDADYVRAMSLEFRVCAEASPPRRASPKRRAR